MTERPAVLDRSRFYLLLIVLGFALLGVLYAQAIPLFEASDEAEHFIYIDTILRQMQLPVIQSRADMAAQTDALRRWNNQSHHAPLYYLLAAGLVSWSQRADLAEYLLPNELIFLRDTTEQNPNKWLHLYGTPRSDTHLAVSVLRALSIVIGCGTLALIYLSGAALAGKPVGLLAAALTAALPTFIVVHASVTNDVLVIFLYSAGILWLIRVWQAARLRPRDAALISVIVAGTALSKLTGASLIGLVGLVLLAGVWRSKWTWRSAAATLVCVACAFVLLAGWWYVRNWQLYGDPFALSATASIWGREQPFSLAMLPDELLRIGKSFWMMVGYLHQPVYGLPAFHLYSGVLTMVGMIGAIRAARRYPALWIAALALLVAVGLLLYGTRSVDISYGRLLFPAIAAFAALLAVGLNRLLGRFAPVALLPVLAMALYAPLVTLPAAYPALEAVAAVPSDATAVDWHSDDLEIVAARIPAGTIEDGQTLAMDLYIRGNHPDNPALLVTAADSWRVQRLGHVEIYPGMAATDRLPDETLWRVPVQIPITIDDDIRHPRSVMLLIRWVNLEDNRTLAFDSGRDLLEMRGPVFVDRRYQAPQIGQPVAATFGNLIRLDRAEIPATAQANQALTLSFRWEALAPIADDWTLTVQLFDTAGTLVAQIDETPYWYVTSAWIPALPFVDQRTLTLPASLPAGEVTLRAGWYRQVGEQFIRMQASAADVRDDLALLGVVRVE